MAKMEITLNIDGVRFGAYDEVELVLKKGRIVKGKILPISNLRSFYLDTPQRVEVIYADDIKGYIPKNE